MSSEAPKILITRAVMITCIVYDPEEYAPDLRALWQKVLVDLVRQGIAPPTPYPDSVIQNCQECGVRVCVGPRQFAQYHDLLTQGGNVVITCMICGTLMARKAGGAHALHLGNPAHDG
jgi:hypothetical protein